MTFHGKSVLMPSTDMTVPFSPGSGLLEAGISVLQKTENSDNTSLWCWENVGQSCSKFSHVIVFGLFFSDTNSQHNRNNLLNYSFLGSSFQPKGSPDTAQVMRKHLLLFYCESYWYLSDGRQTHGVPRKMEPMSWMLVLLAIGRPLHLQVSLVTSISASKRDWEDFFLLVVPQAHVQPRIPHNKTPWVPGLTALGDTPFPITTCSHLPFST